MREIVRVISIINLKGGVGKTLTSITMAFILAKLFGKKVLILDNDKQGNATKFFELYKGNRICGMAKLLMKKEKDVRKLIRHTKYEGIDIIDSNMHLMTATNIANLDDSQDKALIYKKLCEEVKDEYDYIIIDNPPDITLNVVNALLATDDVIVPVGMNEWSLDGLDIITEQIDEAMEDNEKLNLLGILPTIYRNNDADICGIEFLKQKGYKLFDTKIRYSKKVEESIFRHESIVDYSRRSGAAVDYVLFVREYLEKIKEGA